MGVGKGGGSAPQLDAAFVNQQQQQSNLLGAINQQRLNSVNQVTPFGTLTYEETGGTHDWGGNWIPQWTATTKLSPEQQKLFDTQMSVSQGTSDLAKAYIDRIGSATATPFTLDGLPAAGTVPTWNYDENARVASRDRILARNAPTMERDRAALETRLRNQGLVPGTAAWNAAYDDYSRGVNDFRLGADIQAQGDALQQAQAGFDAASRIFGLQGDLRGRAIQERLLERTQPINEVAALLGTGPGVQLPQFVSTPQTSIAATDTTTPYLTSYQGQVQQQQAQQQAQAQLLGSLFGVAGSALGGWGLSGFKT